MTRIAILTCSNATQEANCASVSCLKDLRERNGFFKMHPENEPIELVGIIPCAGCPTTIAHEKILKKIASVAEYKIDAIHFTFCMTALCPFIFKYEKVIHEKYPDIKIIFGTHPEKTSEDIRKYQKAVKEILAPTVCPPQDMNDLIKRRFKMAGEE